MLILFLAYAITQSTRSDAGPIPTSIDLRDTALWDDPNSQRSSWSVIWSCLSTIFLCTWVAIHPNVRFRPETQGQKWYRSCLWDPLCDFVAYRLVLFAWALLVPEYVLAWAVRQYIRAGEIRDSVPGWTITQGFFVVMGGFHLFQLPADTQLPYKTEEISGFVVQAGEQSRRDAVPLCPLEFEDFSDDIYILDITAPTEIELKDRGKSDALTKIIVLVQTLWFVVQCIARGTQHLPLTELEIVTLAYAMLNFFIYIFWWNKPRNVECPIRVYKTWMASQEESTDIAKDWEDNWAMRWMEQIFVYTIGMQDKYVALSGECSIPMFWSGRMETDHLAAATLGPAILGSAFGAIHCIAWSSAFSSRDELLLWRISCIAMITIPFIVAFFCACAVAMERMKRRRERADREPIMERKERKPRVEVKERKPTPERKERKPSKPSKLKKMRRSVIEVCFKSILFLLVVSSFVLYIVSRIITLVMAFTSLRSLPPAALITVEWTTFIPHLGSS
ncbi:hypothetical protein M408DRAFT_23950 [Serendipita vermifera MAFF 305830]|uniref:Uncharacterized protein n=1 Tax=Serendipita vermifera MAFF 305830 TaxID=933852 RepID=A0A0C3B9W3_SERVB|nr:hypothetical protein M408DRAFT_23950 [Serendipita vermifera MAFF 305830]